MQDPLQIKPIDQPVSSDSNQAIGVENYNQSKLKSTTNETVQGESSKITNNAGISGVSQISKKNVKNIGRANEPNQESSQSHNRGE